MVSPLGGRLRLTQVLTRVPNRCSIDRKTHAKGVDEVHKAGLQPCSRELLSNLFSSHYALPRCTFSSASFTVTNLCRAQAPCRRRWMYRCSPVPHRIYSSLNPRIRKATASVAPLPNAASRTRRARFLQQAQDQKAATSRPVSSASSGTCSKPTERQERGRSPHNEFSQVVSDHEAAQDRLNRSRHIKSVSEAKRHGRPPHHHLYSRSGTNFEKQKQELENDAKDPLRHELPRDFTDKVTLPEQNKQRRRTQSVAHAIHRTGTSAVPLVRMSPRQKFPSSRQTLRASRNVFWYVNYHLLRWINGEHRDVEKVLAIHRQRAKLFARRGSWQMNTRWTQVHTRRPTLGLSIIIGSLAHSAKQALTLLGSIPNRPSLYFVHADSLFFLRQSRWEEIQTEAKLAKRFWDQVERSRDVTCWPKQPIRAWHLDLLLQNIPQEEQHRMLSAYLDKYEHLDDLRLLYIVDCYTRLKDVDASLSILRRVSQTTLQRKGSTQQKSWAVAPRFTNLLKLESVEQAGESHSFKVLPAILELGVPPDDLIYDLVTQNSIKFELPAVAWDVFRYARAQGALIGPQTHLMLLKDSYLRRNATTLNEMLSIIQQSPELYQHPPINAYMMNIIRGICIYERGSGPAEALARMLAVYDKAYTRAPLARVGIIPDVQARQGNPDLPEPKSLPFAFMIFSYIMVQKDQVVVTRFWERLVSKMNQGDRELLAAARHPVFYDGFICFYSKTEQTISRALSILRYMLASETCLPGDITWSIVIGMFLRHGKEESAENIRQLMLQRGVSVTGKAWQQVLLSYPHTELAQEVKKILRLEPKPKATNNPSVQNDDGSETDISGTSEGFVDITKS